MTSNAHASPLDEGQSLTGMIVTFHYADDFDHGRVVKIAADYRGMFEGMPAFGSRSLPSMKSSSGRRISTCGTRERWQRTSSPKNCRRW